MRKGIHVEDVRLGDGAVAEKGRRVTVRYDGFLSRGEPFQTSVNASFTIGRREVVAGLEYGLEGMRAGGRRLIRVSPHLGYRDKGVSGIVPPNALLLFDVELLAVGDGD